VLTGILVGLLARLAGRGPLGLLELAAHAVTLHARAAERYREEFPAEIHRAAIARDFLSRIG
jgi:NAD(P)H-hydrate repair Nnr-like enzyme with NAD(P)H-hydrate dehydratase domain